MTTVPLAAGALLFYGLCTSAGKLTFSSLVQARVPEDLCGRAFAGFDLLWRTGPLRLSQPQVAGDERDVEAPGDDHAQRVRQGDRSGGSESSCRPRCGKGG